MPRILNLQRLILASAAFAIMAVASSTAFADPIVITVGNPGNQNTDNVLFNNGSLIHFGFRQRQPRCQRRPGSSRWRHWQHTIHKYDCSAREWRYLQEAHT